ncbi:MAG: hypothetical protein L3J19_02035 [Sulfurimonas sp.]|nr:hypothetical protein [Sulfurimonas sp.]
MKTIRLSTLFLGAVMFLGFGFTTASAEGMKCGAGKCGSSMKTPRVQAEAMKDDSKKLDTHKKSSKFESYQKWSKEYSKDKNQRGVISTH